ncbi:MAG TPA: TIM44-like domain-containing protein [Polyangiaceae bacterium]|nr:TIM44-like domain-containing protein [Polyangiaceae bacterium]
MNRKGLLALLLAAAVLLVAGLALARPGGGEAYKGGSSRSSGSFSTGHSSSGSRGGGGGGGDVDMGLIIELVALCFRYPPLGMVVLAGVGGFYFLKMRAARGQADWSTGMPARVEARTRSQSARSELTVLRGDDAGFSVVLFEDFAYALYAEIHVSRARGAIARLAAFLTPSIAQLLYDPVLERVDGIVIGSLRYVGVELGKERAVVTLELEANFTEVRQGQAQRYYVADRVTLSRARSARSRPPARARKLDCPNCGAPLEGMRGTTCAYCQTEVGGGRLDWLVEGLERVTTELRPPLVTTDVPESGNRLPTLVAPGSDRRFAELLARDPANDPAALWARIGLIFAELQLGWSARDLSRIRPFVSDNLFQYFGYWIDVYVASQARNVTENARILNLELAEVLEDAVYDAVTVRLFATGLDYTLGDDGRLLRGSRTEERPYSEYWTLIRGHAARGRPRTEPVCPCCGAPLKIGMAGNCEYCHARVVTGEFDWVLSRIEQDEAYG